MKKIVFAPDSFKGSLSALDIVRLLAQAAEKVFPGVQTVPVPVADGGEGTVDALVLATGGKYREAVVTGPLGAPVTARYGVLHGGKTAVVEMAQASGLPLVKPHEKDPLRASSAGTGELVRRVLDEGITDILLGLGGSATNDGGMGFLRALGARFLTAQGGEAPEGARGLEMVARADFSGLDARLRAARVTAICDVTNPLLGERGATYIYGPQKGVKEAQLAPLDAGMARYAAAVEAALGREIKATPGAGAAGGMGAAVLCLPTGALRRGIDAVLDAVRFDELLRGADLAVTAEGRMDRQSIDFGKVPVGVAERCKAAGVPVAAIVGGMDAQAAARFCERYRASVTATVSGPMPLAQAIADAPALFAAAAERMFRFIAIGEGIGG